MTRRSWPDHTFTKSVQTGVRGVTSPTPSFNPPSTTNTHTNNQSPTSSCEKTHIRRKSSCSLTCTNFDGGRGDHVKKDDMCEAGRDSEEKVSLRRHPVCRESCQQQQRRQQISAKDSNSQSCRTSLRRYDSNCTDCSSVRLSIASTTPSSINYFSSQKTRVVRRLTNRKLLVVRHGERVDFTFGTANWLSRAFHVHTVSDPSSNSSPIVKSPSYTQFDLNMPESLPARASGPLGFFNDSPLTSIGCFQGQMLGGALKNRRSNDSSPTFIKNQVYSSPSLRCVQTAHHILQGMGLQHSVKINVEPGLFEWLAWFGGHVGTTGEAFKNGSISSKSAIPDWMNVEELRVAGYNINMEYKPFIASDELWASCDEGGQSQLINGLTCQSTESLESYYSRNAFVTQCVLQSNEVDDAPTDVLLNDQVRPVSEESAKMILLVGHAATLEVCTRHLRGERTTRPYDDFMRLIRSIPYCSVVCADENLNTDDEEDDTHHQTSSVVNPIDIDRMSRNSGHYSLSLYEGGNSRDGCNEDLASLTSTNVRRSDFSTSWTLVAPPIPPMTQSASTSKPFDWNLLVS